jgi:hypothetical protein
MAQKYHPESIASGAAWELGIGFGIDPARSIVTDTPGQVGSTVPALVHGIAVDTTGSTPVLADCSGRYG